MFALIDTTDGVNNATAYPGFVGDNDRRIDKWSFLANLRPLPYLWFSYKLVGQDTDYIVTKEPSQNIGQWESVIHSVSCTVAPVERLIITGFFSFEDTTVTTKAEDNVTFPIPSFNGETSTVSVDANYGLTEQVGLLAGFSYTDAKSLYDYKSTHVYVGGTFKINEMWSADARYSYYDFNESGNGSIDDYSGNLFSVGVTGRF